MRLLENKFKYISFSLTILGLLLLVVGVTYAGYNYIFGGNQNDITTGRIKFSYTEASNALSISNPESLSDEQAKVTNNYFEFDVSASVTGELKIGYYVYLTVNREYSKLPDDAIKVYLTKVNNQTDSISSESVVVPYDFVDNLVKFNPSNLTYDSNSNNFILYTNSFNFKYNNSLQTHHYRFRMWIDQTYYDNNKNTTEIIDNDGTHQAVIESKYYKLTINVIGIDGEPINITAQ